ncbi:OLD family endonuclease [Meridianimarinicoccus roseus]|uniref:OLD family endonuclease n=1 Tax=Meridianimarinicoccus roseus TaxID=2072018 RepID=A0A2V2LFY5_9RHOB|nr:OLD family endonuclease [Meridianimarinicoccus roseus]
MRLVRFQVRNFRSVEDSGWLEVDDVTALIGVNESGKTNLLLPLWKLNPAREGAIEPTSDFPKPKFGEIRADPGAYWFIEAEFTLDEIAARVAELSGLPLTGGSAVRVRRFYDGHYDLHFPEHAPVTTITAQELGGMLGQARALIAEVMPLRDEGEVYNAVLGEIDALMAALGDGAPRDAAALAEMRARIMAALPETPDAQSALVPRVHDLAAGLVRAQSALEAVPPHGRAGVLEAILSALPKFVYYSNYGNLDSEIYLPHVVENLEREDLGSKEAAKARTLRVLFGFVRLSAQEILDLGSDVLKPAPAEPRKSGWFGRAQKQPDEKDLEKIAEQKRTRSILLQSAGTDLTRSFRDWWQQGDYRFRFEADGNFFRIWVADSRRPAEVELENRSTGLQWFLSFYLVFLVESKGAHRDAVLLLDEPGVSLHPLAQRDLSAFFEQLGRTNQLIYTSHSPFLVEADRLDRARKVFVAPDGTTKVTSTLGGSEGTDTQKGAAYAVQSALNLGVAEGLLPECCPVLVEDRSDQHYLAAIKTLLIASRRLAPEREMVFAPAGGTRTAHVIAGILTGREETLPRVLLDGDEAGQAAAQALRDGIYAADADRVLDIAALVDMDGAAIEDLFPRAFLAEEMDRIERTPEVRLLDIVKPDRPFAPQVADWAASQGLTLGAHWQTDLSLRVKRRALQLGPNGFDDAVLDGWAAVFARLAP